jgi:hypothetical protein
MPHNKNVIEEGLEDSESQKESKNEAYICEGDTLKVVGVKGNRIILELPSKEEEYSDENSEGSYMYRK